MIGEPDADDTDASQPWKTIEWQKILSTVPDGLPLEVWSAIDVGSLVSTAPASSDAPATRTWRKVCAASMIFLRASWSELMT